MSAPVDKNQPIVSQEDIARHDAEFAKKHPDIAGKYSGGKR